MLKYEVEKYRRNLHKIIDSYATRIFKDRNELNIEVRKFMQYAVPKDVHLALSVILSDELNEETVTMRRKIAQGKRHWIYNEFIEHNGFMLPKWYVSAKIQQIRS
jgi:hypothetical protein